MAKGKKEIVELASKQLDLLKILAGKNPDALKKIAEMEKEFQDAKGEQKELSCKGCGKKKLLSPKLYEIQKARWFTCPHGDTFCPDCLGKERKESIEKRKKDKEAKKHEKEKKEKK